MKTQQVIKKVATLLFVLLISSALSTITFAEDKSTEKTPGVEIEIVKIPKGLAKEDFTPENMIKKIAPAGEGMVSGTIDASEAFEEFLQDEGLTYYYWNCSATCNTNQCFFLMIQGSNAGWATSYVPVLNSLLSAMNNYSYAIGCGGISTCSWNCSR